MTVDPVTGRVFVDDLTMGFCSALAFTHDAGATWTQSAAGCTRSGHQSLEAGPPRTSTPIGYPNVVYRCAISGGTVGEGSTAITCQRSINGGSAWVPPGSPAYTFAPGVLASTELGCTGGSGKVVVSRTGTVLLPRNDCGQPWLALSDDEGLTWRRVQVSTGGSHCGAIPLDPPFPLVRCDHEATIAEDGAGSLYYGWIGPDSLPYVSVSGDGGETWKVPASLAAPSVTRTSHLQVAAGDAGRIAFVYYGTLNGTGFTEWDGSTGWNAYLGVSLDAAAQDPIYAIAQLNPADAPLVPFCDSGSCLGPGEFIDIKIGPDGKAWAAVVGSCDPRCNEGANAEGHGDAFVATLEGLPPLRLSG